MNDGLLRSAYALQQAGNLSEAARLYDEAARANPRNFDAVCLLGIAQAQLGRREDAQRSADDALKIVSRSSRDLYHLDCLLQRLSRHEDALASYAAFAGLFRYEESQPCYDRALALKPDWIEAHVVQSGAPPESFAIEARS